MEIKDADKCDSSNTDEIKEHIKELCKNGACSGEFKDVLFPQKFIRIKYICQGNNKTISRRGVMLQIQCNKCAICLTVNCCFSELVL